MGWGVVISILPVPVRLDESYMFSVFSSLSQPFNNSKVKSLLIPYSERISEKGGGDTCESQVFWVPNVEFSFIYASNAL